MTAFDSAAYLAAMQAVGTAEFAGNLFFQDHLGGPARACTFSLPPCHQLQILPSCSFGGGGSNS